MQCHVKNSMRPRGRSTRYTAKFFAAVAEELGTERALALHAEAHEAQGLKSGELLKRTVGETPGIERLGALLQASNLSIGINSLLAACE